MSFQKTLKIPNKANWLIPHQLRFVRWPALSACPEHRRGEHRESNGLFENMFFTGLFEPRGYNISRNSRKILKMGGL